MDFPSENLVIANRTEEIRQLYEGQFVNKEDRDAEHRDGSIAGKLSWDADLDEAKEGKRTRTKND